MLSNRVITSQNSGGGGGGGGNLDNTEGAKSKTKGVNKL